MEYGVSVALKSQSNEGNTNSGAGPPLLKSLHAKTIAR